jgi:putative peptidoglycan lipid II flippase
VATFFSRGDTATPVKAALIAAAVNIGFKVLLMGPLAQVGLALATSIGAWINLGLVIWFAHRAGLARIDERLRDSALKLAGAGLVLAAVLWLVRVPVMNMFEGWHQLRSPAVLLVVAIIGGAAYGAVVLTTFGRDWLKRFRAIPR